MEIKKATHSAQLHSLFSVYREVFLESPYHEDWSEGVLAAHIDEILESKNGIAFYAEENDTQVGMILARYFVWHDGMRVFIEDLFVDPKQQRKGIGKLLMEKLEAEARIHGCVAIDLLTKKDADAVEFYRRQNYEPTGYIQFSKKL